MSSDIREDVQDVLVERGKRYGDFRDHSRISQALKRMVVHGMWMRYTMSQATTEVDWVRFNRAIPEYVVEGVGMICHKLARIANGDPLYDDSWQDIAGYATLVVQRLREDADSRMKAAQQYGSDPNPQSGQYKRGTAPDPGSRFAAGEPYRPDLGAVPRPGGESVGPDPVREPAEPGNLAGPRLRAGIPQDVPHLSHSEWLRCGYLAGYIARPDSN